MGKTSKKHENGNEINSENDENHEQTIQKKECKEGKGLQELSAQNGGEPTAGNPRPFVCLFVFGGGANTCCAPRRHAEARLDRQGRPLQARRGAMTRRHIRRRRRGHSLVTTVAQSAVADLFI